MNGIISDSDGVLLSTEDINFEAWRNTFSSNFGIKISEESYAPHAGKSGIDIARELLSQHDVLFNPEAIYKKKQNSKAKLLYLVKPMPYSKEFLETIARNGVPFLPVSSSSRNELKIKLETAGLLQYTDGRMIGCEDGPKYSAGLLLLGIDHAVAIDDSKHGIESAFSLGLDAIAVPNKFTKGHAFPKGTIILPSLKETLEYLEVKKYINR